MDYTLNCIAYDDYICLADQIVKRRLDEYILQLDITTNPHRDQQTAKILIERLLQKRRIAYGLENAPPKLDKEGLLALKQRLSGTASKIQVK